MMGLNLHTWKSGKINLTTTPLQYWGHYSIKVTYYTLLVTFLISTATGISNTLLNYLITHWRKSLVTLLMTLPSRWSLTCCEMHCHIITS